MNRSLVTAGIVAAIVVAGRKRLLALFTRATGTWVGSEG
jgi:hypothetical protein